MSSQPMWLENMSSHQAWLNSFLAGAAQIYTSEPVPNTPLPTEPKFPPEQPKEQPTGEDEDDTDEENNGETKNEPEDSEEEREKREREERDTRQFYVPGTIPKKTIDHKANRRFVRSKK